MAVVPPESLRATLKTLARLMRDAAASGAPPPPQAPAMAPSGSNGSGALSDSDAEPCKRPQGGAATDSSSSPLNQLVELLVQCGDGPLIDRPASPSTGSSTRSPAGASGHQHVKALHRLRALAHSAGIRDLEPGGTRLLVTSLPPLDWQTSDVVKRWRTRWLGDTRVRRSN